MKALLTGPIIRQFAQFSAGLLTSYGLVASNEAALIVGVIEGIAVLALTIRARLAAGN